MDKNTLKHFSVNIDIPKGVIVGDFTVPEKANTLVIFAHGSGSSRHSPRNKHVAQILNDAGFATLLLDLLTPDEEREDQITGHLRFNIDLLAQRLITATDWVLQHQQLRGFKIGYFGASTGAAAALKAAAEKSNDIHAVVSRGGRPDLAGNALPQVKTPTLLIVGGLDTIVIQLNEEANNQLQCHSKIDIVPGATHLFEEPGTLDQVAFLATQWFKKYLIN